MDLQTIKDRLIDAAEYSDLVPRDETHWTTAKTLDLWLSPEHRGDLRALIAALDQENET